ncbi:hypothetical protein MRB53_041296 [Persea americana]|nr:hypothetical protein MRB53_041296 [Persea americana]
MPTASACLLLKHSHVETLAHSDGFHMLRQHLAHYYKFSTLRPNLSLASNGSWSGTLSTPFWFPSSSCSIVHARLEQRQCTWWERSNSETSSLARPMQLSNGCNASCPRRRSAHGVTPAVVLPVLSTTASHPKPQSNCSTLHVCLAMCTTHSPSKGPSLPSFMFFVDHLARAVAKEEAFHENLLELTLPKALLMRDGVEELIHQTLELEIVQPHAATPGLSTPGSSTGSSLPPSPIIDTVVDQSRANTVYDGKTGQRQELGAICEGQAAGLLQHCWDHIKHPAQTDVDRIHAMHLDTVLQSSGGVVAVTDIIPG